MILDKALKLSNIAVSIQHYDADERVYYNITRYQFLNKPRCIQFII